MGLLAIGVWLFVMQIANTGIENIWLAIKQVSLVSFLLYLFLSFVNMCLHTLRWDVILHHHHQAEQIPFHRLLLHRISAYAVSYLTPAALTGGEPVRIFFLQQDNVPIEQATSATVIDKILELSALFLFIVLGVIVAVLSGSFPDYSGTVVAVSIAALFALIFWFYYATIRDIGFLSSVMRGLKLTRIKGFKRFEKKVIKIEKQMAKFYQGHWSKLALLIFLSVLTMGFMVFEHWLLAYFLGVALNFKQSFLSGTIPGVSYIIPIPGALGALEHSHAVVFDLMEISINAFAFVLILRLRDMVFVLIGIIHASSFGWQMMKEIMFGKAEKKELD